MTWSCRYPVSYLITNFTIFGKVFVRNEMFDNQFSICCRTFRIENRKFLYNLVCYKVINAQDISKTFDIFKSIVLNFIMIRYESPVCTKFPPQFLCQLTCLRTDSNDNDPKRTERKITFSDSWRRRGTRWSIRDRNRDPICRRLPILPCTSYAEYVKQVIFKLLSENDNCVRVKTISVLSVTVRFP